MANNNLVIVTKQCYLICQSINYISMGKLTDEEKTDMFGNRQPKKTRRLTRAEQKLLKEEQLYQITIEYVPTPSSANSSQSGRSSSDCHSVTITTVGEKRCSALFQDMVNQIREQMPDHLFLDKLVEKFLTDNSDL